jgi:hypothetical protein
MQMCTKCSHTPRGKLLLAQQRHKALSVLVAKQLRPGALRQQHLLLLHRMQICKCGYYVQLVWGRVQSSFKDVGCWAICLFGCIYTILMSSCTSTHALSSLMCVHPPAHLDCRPEEPPSPNTPALICPSSQWHPHPHFYTPTPSPPQHTCIGQCRDPICLHPILNVIMHRVSFLRFGGLHVGGTDMFVPAIGQA